MDHGDQPPVPAPAELFGTDPDRVAAAVRAALGDLSSALDLPATLPRSGLQPETALGLVTPYLRGGGRNLGDPGFLAHMDPPTPWISWVAALVGASSNQNLLHPDTAPAARRLEATVIDWIAPIFGMGGGHLVPGSTVANLTALWAARELTGADTVVASTHSHLSIRKAATILGLQYRPVSPAGTASGHRVTAADLGDQLEPARSIVCQTAGTTGVGAIDQLDLAGMAERPAWVHVDAAWGGPLCFSPRHRRRLDGIERADSIAISAHKWLFQPKESAMVLFADVERSNRAISIDGAYLQAPNVGLLGSHGTAAAPLAATLLALGRDGIAGLIDRCMAMADELAALVGSRPELEVFGRNETGVVAWRHVDQDSTILQAELSGAFVSTVTIDGTTWLRSVAANPMAEPPRVVAAALAAAERLQRSRP